MSNKLFNTQSYGLNLAYPFNSLADRTSTIHTSKYGSGTATLHTASLRAVLEFTKLDIAMSSKEGYPGAIGEQNPTYHLGEYRDSNGNLIIVAHNKINGKFAAAMMEGGLLKSYHVGPGEKNKGIRSALLYVLMTPLMQNDEFTNAYAGFRNECEYGFKNIDKAAEFAFVLCDNMRGRIENQKLPESVLCDISATGRIPKITAMALSQGIYSYTDVFYGQFTQLVQNIGGKASGKSKIIPHKDFVGSYTLPNSQNQDKEMQELPSWYVIPEQAETICKHILDTTGTK